MPISYQYKTIFIHIPKCAGTSVEKILGMAAEEEFFSHDRIYFMKEIVVDRSKFTSDEYMRCVSKTPQHLSFMELKKILPPTVFDGFKKFTIVRNPFSRVVSELKYNLTNNSLPDIKDFSSILKYLNEDKFIKTHRFDGHLDTQTSFLINDSGELDPSIKIFKFENINECFDELYKISPIKRPIHARKNMGAEDYKEYYTQEFADIVREYYKEDFINFNYSMDL